MDNNQFNNNYLPYGQSQSGQNGYGNSSQQNQQSPAQQSSGNGQHTPHDSSHPTLPPLQNPNGFSQFGTLNFNHPPSASQTPTAPPTPVTNSANGYAHLAHAHAAFSPSYPMTTQSLPYPASSIPAIAPSPTAGLPNLRPMPTSSLHASMASLPSIATGHMGHQSFVSNEEAPTHVVGSQGRRGILPSAPGRPNAAPGMAGGQTKNIALVKDAEGKFPCPHCNKTYLHAKHLKRHMLRHTGDRPYSCHLCKDTFSRSDILKRHFQKCSIRRGNPSGLSHLAHQRRNNNTNRLSISQQEGPIGLAGLSEVAGNNPYSAGGMVEHSTPVNGDLSTRTSRANSLITPASMSHRNSVAGLGIVSPNGHASDLTHPQSQYGPPPTMHGYGMTNGSNIPSAYAFAQPPMQNGVYMPMQGQQPLPFMSGHAPARYDNSHNSSPHNQSPTVGEASQQQLNGGRLLGDGQDGYINGNVDMNSDNTKSEHDNFNGDANGSLPPPWP